MQAKDITVGATLRRQWWWPGEQVTVLDVCDRWFWAVDEGGRKAAYAVDGDWLAVERAER